MKRIFTLMMAMCSIALLMLSSCKKDETKVTSSLGSAGTLSASTTTPSLALATAANAAVTFNLSAATPVTGYQAPVTYVLQIDKKGNNFASAQTVAATSSTTTMSQDDLNNVLHSLNLADGTSTQVEVRVKSYTATNIDAAYSNVLTLTVTPYSKTSYLYAVGAFQGWNLTTATALASATSNGIYIGTITFTAGNREFLVLPQNTSYDNKYATSTPTTTTSSTIVQNGPNNLAAPDAPGKYTVTVNTKANTISFVLVP